jgi:hypothetical protein
LKLFVSGIPALLSDQLQPQLATDKRGGACWVVERSFAWLSRYRRLNIIFFERSHEHLIAFVDMALHALPAS